MANVNVNRENTDQFYRYKMPSLMAKVSACAEYECVCRKYDYMYMCTHIPTASSKAEML